MRTYRIDFEYICIQKRVMKTIIFVWDRNYDLIPKEDTISKTLEASAPTTLLWRRYPGLAR